jgi:hypothetical protein
MQSRKYLPLLCSLFLSGCLQQEMTKDQKQDLAQIANDISAMNDLKLEEKISELEKRVEDLEKFDQACNKVSW